MLKDNAPPAQIRFVFLATGFGLVASLLAIMAALNDTAIIAEYPAKFRAYKTALAKYENGNPIVNWFIQEPIEPTRPADPNFTPRILFLIFFSLLFGSTVFWHLAYCLSVNAALSVWQRVEAYSPYVSFVGFLFPALHALFAGTLWAAVGYVVLMILGFLAIVFTFSGELPRYLSEQSQIADQMFFRWVGITPPVQHRKPPQQSILLGHRK